jgi:hypothetical protein
MQRRLAGMWDWRSCIEAGRGATYPPSIVRQLWTDRASNPPEEKNRAGPLNAARPGQATAPGGGVTGGCLWVTTRGGGVVTGPAAGGCRWSLGLPHVPCTKPLRRTTFNDAPKFVHMPIEHR